MAAKKKMIHTGKYEVTVPAKFREEMVRDPEAENFGKVVQVEVESEHKIKGTHPPGTRFGRYPIGQVVEVAPEDVEELERHGFVEAKETAVSKAEKLAAKEATSEEELLEAERQRAASFEQANKPQRGGK